MRIWQTLILWVWMCNCLESGLYAQTINNDSLNRILNTQNDDTSKVIKLDSLSRIFLLNNNLQTAYQYATEALALSKKAGYKKGEAISLENLAFFFAVQHNYAEVRKMSFATIAISELLKDEKRTAGAYELIGKAFGLEENFPEAIKYLYEALKRWEKLENQEKTALCLTDIAFCYYHQDNSEECLKHISSAIELYKKIDNKDGLARTYNFMASLYLEKGNFDAALEMDSAVFKIYRALNNEVETFYVFQNMGNIDEKKGEMEFNNGNKESAHGFYKKALNNYGKALVSSQRGTDSSLIAEAFENLGRIRIKLKDFEEARNNLITSLSLGKDSKLNLKSVYGSLATLDSAQGNYKGAYEHFKKYILYRDSLNNEESTKKSLQSKMQYEFDNKEAAAKLTQLEVENEQKRKRIGQWRVIASLGLLILVFLLIMFFQWRGSKQRKRANLLLQKQKEKVEITLSELRSTQSQLIQSEKMASLGELTAGIAHEIQNPLNFVNNFSDVNTELIDELKLEVDKGNMDEVKAIANDIKENEEKINHHGKRADAIVKGMLQHSRSSSGIKEPTDINALADEYLRLAYHGMRAKDKSFNATIKTDFDESIGKINVIPQDIGRVILNLITNAFYVVNVKKNQGLENYEPTITVKTIKTPPSGGREANVLISVKDNGLGISQKILDKIFQPFFTTKPTGQGTGLGLSLSYDIVKAHGGELKVETKEGEGSEFIIQLPV